MTQEVNKLYKIQGAREVTRVTPQIPNVVRTSSGQGGTLGELAVGWLCREDPLKGHSLPETQPMLSFSVRQLPICHPCSWK